MFRARKRARERYRCIDSGWRRVGGEKRRDARG